MMAMTMLVFLINVATCPVIDIANGMVSFTGTSLEDTATYSCKTGFELVGASVLNCLSGGRWDNPPPVCLGPAGRV